MSGSQMSGSQNRGHKCPCHKGPGHRCPGHKCPGHNCPVTYSYNLRERNSVFQAEVEAISQAAATINKSPERIPENTVFYSDCKGAILALKKYMITSDQVRRCISNLTELSKRTKIKIRWIKAHVGHYGNEIADLLAKRGTKKGLPEGEALVLEAPRKEDEGIKDAHDIPAPYSLLTLTIREGVEKWWTDRWHAEEKGGKEIYRQTKYFFQRPDKEKSRTIMNHSKHEVGTMIQFITGHCYMKRHQALVDREEAPDKIKCRWCKQYEETPFHTIWNCDALYQSSVEFFGEQEGDPNEKGFSISWGALKLKKFTQLPRIASMLTPDLDEVT